MAFQQIPGGGLWIPSPLSLATNQLGPTTALTASTHMVFMSGRLFWAGRSGTKNIQTVAFKLGGVTKTNGSTLTVGLYNVSTSAGVPAQPTGSALQSCTILNGDGGFVSSGYYVATLGAVQNVMCGQQIGVQFNISAADSVVLQCLYGLVDNQGVVSFYNGTTWAVQAQGPNILFGFDDGTWGSFDSANMVNFASNSASQSYQSGSASNEYGLQWQLPFPHKIDAVAFGFNPPVIGATVSVQIWDNQTGLLASPISPDPHTYGSINNNKIMTVALGQEISCSANHTYYAGLKATAATNISLCYHDVANNAHMSAQPFGTSAYLAYRKDSGSWSTTQTRRPGIAIRVSSLDDGTGGGTVNNIFILED